jgi:hypothetical protein
MAKYEFLNVNPLGFKEKDCVCRAISQALQEDYYLIAHKLELVGELFECTALCVCCYKFLLDNVYGLTRIEEYKGMTVEEFANKFPKGKYIIRVDQHLTTIQDGTILDIWDCSKEIVDIVWKA